MQKGHCFLHHLAKASLADINRYDYSVISSVISIHFVIVSSVISVQFVIVRSAISVQFVIVSSVTGV